MSRYLSLTFGFLLCLALPASAQTPSPEAMATARNLVTTMGLADQYRTLLPVILMSLKPVVTQDRPEIEQDYDSMAAMIASAYTPFYNQMVDQAATLYATNFTVDELRQERCITGTGMCHEVTRRKDRRGGIADPGRRRRERSAPRIVELSQRSFNEGSQLGAHRFTPDSGNAEDPSPLHGAIVNTGQAQTWNAVMSHALRHKTQRLFGRVSTTGQENDSQKQQGEPHVSCF